MYEFDIDKTFFEGIENSLIEDGNVRAHLSLEKKETMMIAEFSVEGTVNTVCDRCNDPIELPVQGNYRIIYKFGNEISDDENLIVLDPDAYELNVIAPIYELLCVSLPARILHQPGECNEEMMALYNSYTINAGQPDEDDEDWDDEDDSDPDDNDPEDDDDKPIDPRWSALKNLN